MLLRRLPWWAAVLLVALGARLAYLLLLREPLLYADQYHYLFGGLRIARAADPLELVLRSEEWRSWVGRWTRAPLYTLLAALGLGLGGERLLPLQLLNALLGAAAALGVAALARRCAGRWGAWAGLAQAVYWPAVALCSTTLSENLHTPLLVWALWLLSRAGGGPARPTDALGGFLLGLSCLTRSASTGFVPLAALWRWGGAGLRRGVPAGALVLAGAGAAILPWTARNILFAERAVLIDSVGSFNLWKDNFYLETGRAREGWPFSRDRPGEVPDVGGAWLVRTIVANPGPWLAKVGDNVQHLLRLEGLHLLLREEYPQPAWRHAAAVLLDDGLLLIASGLALGLLAGGAHCRTRGLLLVWLAYYVVLLVAVFHVEIRYRSAMVPFLFVLAAGGGHALFGAGPERRRLALACLSAPALAAGLLHASPACRALAARAELAKAAAALHRGDGVGAARAVEAAAARDPRSARPWTEYGRLLAQARLPDRALEAYRRASQVRADAWAPAFVEPQLLREAGRPEDAARARRRAVAAGLKRGSWLGLEIAWSQLPAPRAERVELPGDDYGASRWLYSVGDGLRWTGRRSRLRLEPPTLAPAYEVRLELASPEPSPWEAPAVELRVRGGPSARFTLSRAFRLYALRVPADAARPLEVEIRAPTWLRGGLRAEPGVAVRSMAIAPLR